MARTKKFKVQEVIDALRYTKGMVILAAQRLGCDPQTIYNYRDRHSAVKAEIAAQDGLVNDIAELKLIAAIHNSEPWAIKYRLSTKGKDRGYTERQEITGADGDSIHVKHIVVKGYVSVSPDDWDDNSNANESGHKPSQADGDLSTPALAD